MARQRSTGEEVFLWHLTATKLPAPLEEYRFHPKRRWRFDFAWPDKMIAVEVEGGTFTGGRHTRGKGFEQDCEKYCEATLLGWRVLRFTTKQVNSGYALGSVERAFNDLS